MVSELHNSFNLGLSTPTRLLSGGPFNLRHEDAYRRWRDTKHNTLANAPPLVPIEISNPYELSRSEKAQIETCCKVHNSCLYAFTNIPPEDPRDAVVALGQALGLKRLDRSPGRNNHPVATIAVASKTTPRPYIPYTNQPINWHTDGYYNNATAQIHGVIMHCIQPATNGGANTLLDPELVYIKVRDKDPAMMDALMASDALCIPANIQEGTQLRPARCGPVFSIDPLSAKLHMRYTARTTSAHWRAGTRVETSTQLLAQILALAKNRAVTVPLAAHQGIICNNVLHTRDGFNAESELAPSRTLLRARFYDRVCGT